MKRDHGLALALFLVLFACAGSAVAGEDRESRDEAWWTGPMIAASAATLPRGHWLVEPYVYDVIGDGVIDSTGHRVSTAHSHSYGSLTYCLYGLSDDFTVGVIPRFALGARAGARERGPLRIGDLSLHTAYRLARFDERTHRPDVSLVFEQRLPTGEFDRLAKASDGTGTGTGDTSIGLYTQEYFWLPNGRILRARLDLTRDLGASVDLRDRSVYGTDQGFVGTARVGASSNVDLGLEYSITQRWVAALDLLVEQDDAITVHGTQPVVSDRSSGSSRLFAWAPAVEYNWSPRMGALFGLRFIEAGRNIGTSVTPVVALNMVF